MTIPHSRHSKEHVACRVQENLTRHITRRSGFTTPAERVLFCPQSNRVAQFEMSRYPKQAIPVPFCVDAEKAAGTAILRIESDNIRHRRSDDCAHPRRILKKAGVVWAAGTKYFKKKSRTPKRRTHGLPIFEGVQASCANLLSPRNAAESTGWRWPAVRLNPLVEFARKIGNAPKRQSIVVASSYGAGGAGGLGSWFRHVLEGILADPLIAVLFSAALGTGLQLYFWW